MKKIRTFENVINFRVFVLFFAYSFFLLVIFWRLFQLQIVYYKDLSARCDAQYLRNIIIAGNRGNIYDSKGKLLATDQEVDSVYLSTRNIKDNKEKTHLIEQLSNILKIPASTLEPLFNKETFFVWLKRKISPEESEAIKNLKSSAVGLIKEYKRVYLKENFFSNILGITGIDNQGLAGVEFQYDQILKGKQGRLITAIGPDGNPLLNYEARILAPDQGKDIYLTIDDFIQYHAQKILEETIQLHSANGGTIIVMEPDTGKILAMASYPNFNPDDPEKFKVEMLRNRAINWVYEPGSTFKVVTVASALNEGVIKPETTFNCPREFIVGGRRIREAHDAMTGSPLKTVTEIVADSLNIGAAQIGLKLGKEKLYNYVKNFGFGDLTGIDLPGEERGILRHYKNWADSDLGIIPFGQSIAVTPLQLLTAVSAIANGGLLVKPYLVESIQSYDKSFVLNTQTEIKRQVISPETASLVKKMMLEVVEKGTGTALKIKGYRIAGKTGTAQKPIPGGLGYWPGHYVSSFVGFFPFEKPKVAILVAIDDPQKGGYYGSVVAGPAFKKLAEELISYLSIPPDEDNFSQIKPQV